jgi:hypothetical protein
MKRGWKCFMCMMLDEKRMKHGPSFQAKLSMHQFLLDEKRMERLSPCPTAA